MKDTLRHVSLETIDGREYRLLVWDTHTCTYHHKSRLGYRFYYRQAGKDTTLFEGEDFACSPSYSVDSDDTLRAIMGFMTLRPGDTDDDWFRDYTPVQIEFAQDDAEQLSLWGLEPEDEDEYPEFTDIEE